MPSRSAAVALAAVAALGLTGCEKQSPYITVTAHGVVVKMRAAEYCRGDDCDKTDDVPEITVRPGDTLGIDVPRSLANEGWRIGDQGDFSKEHYRSVSIGEQFQSGARIPVTIFRDEKYGRGSWNFTVRVK